MECAGKLWCCRFHLGQCLVSLCELDNPIKKLVSRLVGSRRLSMSVKMSFKVVLTEVMACSKEILDSSGSHCAQIH